MPEKRRNSTTDKSSPTSVKQQKTSQYSKMKSLDIERRKLPIYEGKKIIMDHLKAHATTIVIGETGSGKTTRMFFIFVY